MKKSLLLVCVLVGSAHAQNTLAPRLTECTAGLQLPEGFCATVFADSANGARHIVVAPNGDVFINTQPSRGVTPAGGISISAGGILALRDTKGDGKADVRHRLGAGGGTGIALDGNLLYANDGNSIVRYRLASGSLTDTKTGTSFRLATRGGGSPPTVAHAPQ